MIPILYDENEQSFTSEGLCRLTDATRCIVTEELNGIYNLELDYPISGLNYEEIIEGRIIGVIHDDRKDVQPFDIVGRSAPIEGVVTFYAQHISYRLGQLVVKPFTASSITEAMGKLATEAMIQSPFTYWTDKSVASTYQVSSPSAIRSLLGGSSGSILDVYGKGEYEFDKWTVKLYINRGADNGVEIRYGKNLVDLEYKTDISENYNAVAPFWTKDGSTVVLPEGYIVRTGSTGRVKVIPLDLSDSFEDAPTVAELRTLATARLNNSEAWVMDENITVDFIQLWQTEDYKNVAALERVALGDKVAVVHPVLGLAVNRIEVVKVEYDAIEERYTSMELGKKKVSFAEAIMERTKEDVLEIVPDKETMQEAIDYATEMITGVNGGNVVINRDANGRPYELLIMDKVDKADAVNVWRWNLNGLGHSHSGYNGPYNDIALTADGKINASMITTGILQAIKIINGNNTFVVESDGRVTASAINITGGSINISTSTESQDIIELSWEDTQAQRQRRLLLSPLSISLSGYDINSPNVNATVLLSEGQSNYLYNNKVRAALGWGALRFLNTATPGIITASYDGNFATFYNSSGVRQTSLSSIALSFYDTDGSTILEQLTKYGLTAYGVGGRYTLGDYGFQAWASGGNYPIVLINGNGLYVYDDDAHVLFGVYYNSNSGEYVCKIGLTLEPTLQSNINLGSDTQPWQSVIARNVELWGNADVPTPFIDTHWGGSSADYTGRIIESSLGHFTVYDSISGPSDARLKENIADLTEAEKRLIMSLRAKTFSFKNTDVKHAGLIAQEVIEAEKEQGIEESCLIRGTGEEIPDPKHPDKTTIDYYSVDYDSLTTLLLAQVQELTKTVEDLKAKLAKLEGGK